MLKTFKRKRAVKKGKSKKVTQMAKLTRIMVLKRYKQKKTKITLRFILMFTKMMALFTKYILVCDVTLCFQLVHLFIFFYE